MLDVFTYRPTVQVRQGSPAGAKAVAATRVLTVAPTQEDKNSINCLVNGGERAVAQVMRSYKCSWPPSELLCYLIFCSELTSKL